MQRRPLASLFAAVFALCALAPPARAQTTGTLTGHVYDSAGAPIKGVRVVAESDTQIGGARLATTDDQGFFRLTGLSPGRFKVSVSAPKLKTTIVNQVDVVAAGVRDIDIVMDVETTDEEVKIVQKAAPVNVETASVGETFDIEFVDSLPLESRSFQGVMATTPGVNAMDTSGNPGVRGGTYFNNTYTVDGFQTTDPVTHTFSQNFSFTAISSLEVQTAGSSVENSGTVGGLTNIVTRSGTNRLEIDGTLTVEDDHLRLFEDARDIGGYHDYRLSLNVGGPIVKDRVWYFASAEGVSLVQSVPYLEGFPRHPPRSILNIDGFAKLTWQLDPRNKVEAKGSLSQGQFRNQLFSPFVEPEAERRNFQQTLFGGLSWQSLLTDDLFLVLRSGFLNMYLHRAPMSCEWDPDGCATEPNEFDILTAISRRNYSSESKDYRRTFELSGNLEYFLNTRATGAHGIKVGGLFLKHWNPSSLRIPGNYSYASFGQEPFSRTEYCVNDPLLDNGHCEQGWFDTEVGGHEVRFWISDAWKPTRYLTITPGVAILRGTSKNDRAQVVTDITTFAPNVQTAWNATHDGKTVLRASYSNKVDTGFLALARFTSRQLYSKDCLWNEDTQSYSSDCFSSGGSGSTTFGLPCGPDGLNPDGTSCKTALRAPRVHELTVGAEREIVTGVTAGVDVIYRKFVHQWEDLETNAIWNQGGTDQRRDGAWKTGRAQFVYDLETPDEARRRYKAATFFLRREEGFLKVKASYTWSRYDGTDDSSYVSLFLDNPGQAVYEYGPLPDDRRHDARLLATYQFTPWFQAGVTYFFLSGAPYSRYGYSTWSRGYTNFTAQRGYDSRGNLNPDDDTPLRLPDINLLGLQARFSLKPLIKQRVDIGVDVLNLLALRTTLAVSEADTPNFGRQIYRMEPTRARLLVKYWF